MVPGFQSFFAKIYNAQMWMHILGLNWALWHPQILVDIAKEMGLPLKFDSTTINGDFRHYTLILVDIDLAQILPYFVLLDVDGRLLEIEIHYKNLHFFLFRLHECRLCFRFMQTGGKQWERKLPNDIQ